MKKIITKSLMMIILAAMAVSLILNYYLQVNIAYDRERETAQELFWQIEQILEQNETETEQVKADFKKSCLVRAKAAAYIVQYRSEISESQEEMKKVADLLEVDELHLFDTEGNLYAGSEPKYFGMSFNSGEQMQFFLPMLSDRSLQLCQEIMPNTAEQKLMQYAAVWREDGAGIVQIGMEPERVLSVMKKNELSHVFSMVTADKGAAIYAVDRETDTILGATDETAVGKDAGNIGLPAQKSQREMDEYHTTVDGKKMYCVFKVTDSVILVRISSEASLYQEVNRNSGLLALYLLILSALIIFFVSNYLDKHIIKSISEINEKLMEIAKGDWDVKLAERSTPEISELSNHINEMVGSLLDTTNKLSTVLDMVKIPIGVYEYNPSMRRVMATSRIGDILMLTDEETEHLLSDYILFDKKMDEIRAHPINQEKTIFWLNGREERFVRMESFVYEKSILGIVIDVTQDIKEKQHIEHERDIDLLTNLYSRRAFYNQIGELFKKKEELGHAALVMADADNLKQVNDRYGHENGDCYLRAIADILGRDRQGKQIAARLSGDEFALLLYGSSSKEELTDRLRELAEQSNTVKLNDQTYIPVRFSMGYAFYPEDGTDCRFLMRSADERMYEEKKRKKNSVR